MGCPERGRERLTSAHARIKVSVSLLGTLLDRNARSSRKIRGTGTACKLVRRKSRMDRGAYNTGEFERHIACDTRTFGARALVTPRRWPNSPSQHQLDCKPPRRLGALKVPRIIFRMLTLTSWLKLCAMGFLLILGSKIFTLYYLLSRNYSIASPCFYNITSSIDWRIIENSDDALSWFYSRAYLCELSALYVSPT